MEERMTDELMLSLLRRVQEFQYSDCGKSSIGVNVYRSDDGVMFFTYNGKLGNDYLRGECYKFMSYAVNSHKLDEFIRFWENHE